jgi:hypothetical protein
METTLDRLFIDFSISRLKQYSSEIEKCLARLDDERVWARGGQHENAVGNLVLHLCGNVQQRTSAIAGREHVRVREKEFLTTAGISVADLSERLRSTVDEAVAELSALSADRLSQRVVIAEFNQTILETIYHMEVHFALHSGQILFATKMMTGEDLGFYRPPVVEKNK